MPQKTVYIRDEDLPAWKALKNKADRVAFALSLTDYEIQEVLQRREEREKSIKMPEHTGD